MIMLWTSMHRWAPNLVVAVQSNPRYLIEIWLFCVVAVVVCMTILIRKHSSRSLGFHEFDIINHYGPSAPASISMSPLFEDSEEQEVTLDPADAAAGDGVGADPRHWSQSREVTAAHVLPPGGIAHGAHVACAACHQALVAKSPDPDVDLVRTDPSDELLVDDDVEEDVEEDVLGVDYSTSSLGDDQSPEVEQNYEDEGLGQGAPTQGNMVEYVSARYQGFKKAALAGKLLSVDPETSTLLSEQDLVVILSHALKPRRQAPRGQTT